MSAQLTLTIPVWLDFIFTCPLLVFRLLRYGYTFRRINLGEGEWTIVDADVYYRLGRFKWSAAGDNGKMYAARILKKTVCGRIKTMYLHREFTNPPKGLLVDHKNRNTLDNRRANLRLATHSQNTQNSPKRKNTSSKYIGVCFEKRRKKWCAYINYQGKRTWLGYFVNEIDAGRVYDAAARKYFGECAKVNFPAEPKPALVG